MSELIDDTYLEMQKALHQKAEYGGIENNSGLTTHFPKAISKMNKRGICNSVLDYGTGKGLLVNYLKENSTEQVEVNGYDPAVKEFSSRPENPSDLLICIDVLEHIEYKKIDSILDDIYNLTNNLCFLSIDLQPAKKKLPDGQNAHILLAPPDWWVSKVIQRFPCLSTFPLYLESGAYAKVIFFACKKPNFMSYIYEFAFESKLHLATCGFT